MRDVAARGGAAPERGARGGRSSRGRSTRCATCSGAARARDQQRLQTGQAARQGAAAARRPARARYGPTRREGLPGRRGERGSRRGRRLSSSARCACHWSRLPLEPLALGALALPAGVCVARASPRRPARGPAPPVRRGALSARAPRGAQLRLNAFTLLDDDLHPVATRSPRARAAGRP